MPTNSSPLGLTLFFLYLIPYGAFVMLNAFAPESMELTPFGGVNLAILFGFGLIIGAFVLSLIYGIFAHLPHEDSTTNPHNT